MVKPAIGSLATAASRKVDAKVCAFPVELVRFGKARVDFRLESVKTDGSLFVFARISVRQVLVVPNVVVVVALHIGCVFAQLVDLPACGSLH